MRLIDADALEEKVKALHGHGDYEADLYLTDARYCLGACVWDDTEDYGIEKTEKAIKDAPTVDAVQVVRCKDCKYYEQAKVNNKGFLICSASGMEITEADYCSYGERRNDG